jgi:TolB protein
MRRVRVPAIALITLLMIASGGGQAGAKAGGSNGRIAFGRFDPAVGDQVVYTVEPDGSDLRQISEGAAEVPRWSPDGEELATAGLTIYRADGSGSRTLPVPSGFTPDASIFGCNVWSPDGARLACEVLDFEHPERNGIYTLRSTDGGGLRRVTTSPDGDDIPGDFSPAGSRITFLHQDLSRPGNVSWALFIVGVDGSAKRRLTPWGSLDEGRGYAPTGSWSPNGRWIAYAARGRVYVIHPDGSGLTQVAIDTGGVRYGALFPTWSPDGSRLVLTLYLDGTYGKNVYTMRSDGSDLRQVTTALPGSLEVGEGDEFVDWGPQVAASGR